ncbi:hypothetical protein CDL12_04968 [Handroanthus impetiginosus]|uniref:Uncharacterized protein n=1 Tax=Handroanthus impetiginosus TaxID=429701 RepID=A0A2G9HYA6_9LAMI|nr:hypothetical protein CDL12_04968 [Handroanthus impetiginosus]
MGHCCILIPRPMDEEVCRGKRKLEEIPRRLHYWVDVATIVRAKDQEIEELKKRIAKVEEANKELCMLAPVNADAIVKDKEIKEFKKTTVKLEAVTNKDLCVLAPIKVDAAVNKEQGNRAAACEEQGDYGHYGENLSEMEILVENKEGTEKEEENKDGGQDDKESEKKDGKDEEGKEKKDGKDEEGKEKERKDADGEERDHDGDNEYNNINEENWTKHRKSQV